MIELRSETDRLAPIEEKMKEYIENGLRLGWLINPQDRQVEIYRLGKVIEIYTNANNSFWRRCIARI